MPGWQGRAVKARHVMSGQRGAGLQGRTIPPSGIREINQIQNCNLIKEINRI
ncbi:MAG: hypothetical protein RBT49_18755 [Bacteroidales bacterium]|nr:hypothetical protein [Bacteroidales bacterium]